MRIHLHCVPNIPLRNRMTVELAPNTTNYLIHTMDIASDFNIPHNATESADSIDAYLEENLKGEVVV